MKKLKPILFDVAGLTADGMKTVSVHSVSEDKAREKAKKLAEMMTPVFDVKTIERRK
jgi:hypothetical protein